MFTFSQYSDIFIWEKEKFPNNLGFVVFFSGAPEANKLDPKSHYPSVIKFIRYHLPPFVKHVSTPQNGFGMPKFTW